MNIERLDECNSRGMMNINYDTLVTEEYLNLNTDIPSYVYKIAQQNNNIYKVT